MKNKSTLKRLMAFCRPYRIYLVGALLFSTINIIFTLLTPILIGKAIDQMIGYHQVFFQGLSQKIFYIAFSVLMTALFNYFLVRASNKMTYEIHYSSEYKMGSNISKALNASNLSRHDPHLPQLYFWFL